MATITVCTCLKDKRIILPHFSALILKRWQKKKIKCKEKISSVKKNISLINIAYKSKNKIKYIAFSEDDQPHSDKKKKKSVCLFFSQKSFSLKLQKQQNNQFPEVLLKICFYNSLLNRLGLKSWPNMSGLERFRIYFSTDTVLHTVSWALYIAYLQALQPPYEKGVNLLRNQFYVFLLVSSQR